MQNDWKWEHFLSNDTVLSTQTLQNTKMGSQFSLQVIREEMGIRENGNIPGISCNWSLNGIPFARERTVVYYALPFRARTPAGSLGPHFPSINFFDRLRSFFLNISSAGISLPVDSCVLTFEFLKARVVIPVENMTAISLGDDGHTLSSGLGSSSHRSFPEAGSLRHWLLFRDPIYSAPKNKHRIRFAFIGCAL